jgi:ABC-type phosphate transport system ATPase subunit
MEIKDLSVRYGRRIALENLTGAFAAGSMTAIVGSIGIAPGPFPSLLDLSSTPPSKEITHGKP